MTGNFLASTLSSVIMRIDVSMRARIDKVTVWLMVAVLALAPAALVSTQAYDREISPDTFFQIEESIAGGAVHGHDDQVSHCHQGSSCGQFAYGFGETIYISPEASDRRSASFVKEPESDFLSTIFHPPRLS
jgi:hypothetical protein